MTTIVVTGASAGIGRATAELLARNAWPTPLQLFVVGRHEDRTRACARELASSTVEASGLLADFSSLSSVERLAANLLERCDSLDVLVNNAGLWHQERQTSADGFEDTFAVNHLAPFLLTLRVMPLLLASESARVVNVSSRLHRDVGAFDFDDIDTTAQRYRGLQVYGRSKLANVLFTFELARRLEGTTVTASAVHPGAVNTVIVRDNWFLSRAIRWVSPFLKTAEEGAATSVYAASAPELEGVNGGYYADCVERAASPHAYDRDAARRLWDLSLKRVGVAPDALVEVLRG